MPAESVGQRSGFASAWPNEIIAIAAMPKARPRYWAGRRLSWSTDQARATVTMGLREASVATTLQHTLSHGDQIAKTFATISRRARRQRDSHHVSRKAQRPTPSIWVARPRSGSDAARAITRSGQRPARDRRWVQAGIPRAERDAARQRGEHATLGQAPSGPDRSCATSTIDTTASANPASTRGPGRSPSAKPMSTATAAPSARSNWSDHAHAAERERLEEEGERRGLR